MTNYYGSGLLQCARYRNLLIEEKKAFIFYDFKKLILFVYILGYV
jgi:hypothetical protein